MIKKINDCFPDDPTFYYFQYIVFFISATHLENIAIESGRIWEQEMKKLNPDGVFKKSLRKFTKCKVIWVAVPGYVPKRVLSGSNSTR